MTTEQNSTHMSEESKPIEVTDDYMNAMRAKTKPYTVVVLKKGPEFRMPEVFPIIWEHGRRMHQLRLQGLLSVVCPIQDPGLMAGVGIFNCDEEKAKEIFAQDPAVMANVMVFETFVTRTFPGDGLP
jgi:hypothetical protein